MKHTNHLVHETSPYLLQHAHNPVEWYSWGTEALNRAKQENKPILVSIGYAACHWCHVMERESFEQEETAEFMNANFINIKIDREERPDLDHIYMDALQAMTGSGGWPLNVFLTPEARPFYGGTYFPPQPAYNRPSWMDVLTGVSHAFNEKRHEIEAQAENLTAHLLQANAFGQQGAGNEADLWGETALADAVSNIMKTADREWGGFGRAPKFPQTFTIQFLLRYAHFTGDEQARTQALLSLDKMMEGGIYDQVGGGFARYSTDTEWLAPHFEKMLYDNALLVSVFSEAYQLTRDERYKQCVEDTMAFVQRELMHPENGFYAALDADSEGVEGKFYVWTSAEVERILGKDAGLFCEYYDISEKGNWEHTNILRIRKPLAVFAAEKQMEEETLAARLTEGRKKLLQERSRRVRPLLDDKVILGWNALMNTACSKAYAATGNEEYRQLAVANMEFLWARLVEGAGPSFHHTWKNKQAKYPAFLDDYAFLLEALLHLQEITGQGHWLNKAETLVEHIEKKFSDPESAYFFYTPEGQDDVIIRKKEVYDGTVPSGNSVMAGVLKRMGVLLDRPEWIGRSREMLVAMGKAILRYPTSFGNWLGVWYLELAGLEEIAVTGPGSALMLKQILACYIPHRVLMASEIADPNYPILKGKHATDKPTIFRCRNYTCQAPVFSAEQLMLLINRGENS